MNSNLGNQLPRMGSNKWKSLPSLLLGLISMILLFSAGALCGLGYTIAWGFWLAAVVIAIVGLIQGIDEVKLGKKIRGAAGIIACSIALWLTLLEGIIAVGMKTC